MIKYLLLLTTFVFADIAIEPFAKTYHFDRDKDYNENHQYLGLVYRYDQFDFGVATYINSHDERTKAAYVGYRQPMYQDEVEVGLFADIGYKDGYDDNHVLIYGGLYIEYKDFYTKIAVNGDMIGATIGYVFK